MLSLELAHGLPPLVHVALDPDGDRVVEHPGHGGDHAPHLPVPQDDPRHVHPYVATTSCKTRRGLLKGIIFLSHHGIPTEQHK